MIVRSVPTRFAARFAPMLRSLRSVPIIGSALRTLRRRILPEGRTVPVRIKGGIAAGLVLELHPGYISPFQGGDVEPAVSAALQEHAAPGGVFYDLGANMGYFSLSVARLLGSTGLVYAFEADPENAKRIRRNLARNAITNVVVVPLAVWSADGDVTFERSDPRQSPDRGLGHVTSAPAVDGTITVRAMSLDSFVRDHRPPSLIKCDIEGGEVEAMAGARDVLRSARPVVICEMHAESNGVLLQRQFQELKYDTTWLDETHLLARPETP